MNDNFKNDITFKIESIANKNPDKDLIIIEEEKLTYGQFMESINLFSKSLKQNCVAKKAKIGIIIPNSVIWYQIFWAIVKYDAIPVPLDPQIGQWEMERLINLADIEYCFIKRKYRANNIFENVKEVKKTTPKLKKIILIDDLNLDEVDCGDIIYLRDFLKQKNSSNEILNGNDNDIDKKDRPLMIACTSGSTGNPKLIQVPHIGFCKAQLDMAKYLNFNKNDRMLLVMPLYHQGGFGMGLQMVIAGGTLVYQKIFEPVKFLKLIKKYNITILQLTSTLAKIIISVPDFEKYDLSSLKLCYFAGEVLPDNIAKIFYKDLNIRVVNIIGSSETATMIVWDSDFDLDYDVNSYRELTFTKVKILDKNLKDVKVNEVGTIFINTTALITKYYKNERETNKRIKLIDGCVWFDTGDIAKKNENGRISFVGREKRAIKRGSNLVWPEEIESFLMTNSQIEVVAVIGKSNELFGESIVAYIKTKDKIELKKSDIVKFCKNKLAAYKIPDEVIFVDNIPHDIGKIQYKYIRGME